ITPADSVKILSYAMEANRAQAVQKNITFCTDWIENLPNVLADSEKTTWVLTNIISNAIRYSPQNASIFLAIAVENNKIKISVRDEGPGIPPEYREKIFNKYFQVPGSRKEGTGLGLAISKEFIEAQNGKIMLESTSENGCNFVIFLNVA
ncbi:MAG: HAMP domain-containing sensor histidine kinase, partial [Bacteroidales bacterium]|nr:HAMP domain-containing sensor histidine kinase [Bacteroidales bacterium]